MPYSETEPITTKDVIDAIRSKNLDRARDAVQDVLYNKSAEAMADKKVEIAKSIGKDSEPNGEAPIPSIEGGIDPNADIIDAPTEVNPIDYEPKTNEE